MNVRTIPLTAALTELERGSRLLIFATQHLENSCLRIQRRKTSHNLSLTRGINRSEPTALTLTLIGEWTFFSIRDTATLLMSQLVPDSGFADDETKGLSGIF